MTSPLLGLGLGLVGIDLQTGQERYTLGMPEMLDGIGVVIVAVELFAVGETLYVASRLRRGGQDVIPIRGSVWMSRDEWLQSWGPWLRRSLLGFPLGALPAEGADVPTFLSYALEKRLSKHPETFGPGGYRGLRRTRSRQQRRRRSLWCSSRS